MQYEARCGGLIMAEITRNMADEDWDERRDGGNDVPEYELQDFTKILLRNGKSVRPVVLHQYDNIRQDKSERLNNYE